MKPNESVSGQSGSPQLKQWPSNDTPASQKAAADVVRNQINNIYSNSDNPNYQTQPITKPNPYDRTHTSNVHPQDDQWSQYHTAWQTYYQKYYEGYYTHHLTKAKNKLEDQFSKLSSQQSQKEEKIETNNITPISDEEAVHNLRQMLLEKAQDATIKVKKSRHFKPIAAGLIVVIIFLFLQYNRVLISNVVAYISPGNINPQNIIIDPNVEIKVGSEPKLIIPKINVDVPVNYDVGNDYASQMKAMENGVAHFAIPGASSHPGQVGNTAIAGHSSNDLIDSGSYKFIFVQLEKLNVGDTIYANYQSKRYTYVVTKTEVVKPTEVNKLVYPTTKPVLTLITCTPIGTATNRLLVTAEQVSPDPNQSTAAPTTDDKGSSPMPGNSPTLLQRIFGS
jgi:sortase A